MLPAREEAEKLLKEAASRNPGPWENHSRVAAHCAGCIARYCPDLDEEKAYILGLLHDIGRRFGVTGMRHVYDGYRYLEELGYDEAARVCLTHSFVTASVAEYVGPRDTTPEETEEISRFLAEHPMNDYDRLIILCDALAGSEGVLRVEERMNDVKRRYGTYPQKKWDGNLRLKSYFEDKTGKDLYEILGMNG